MVAARGGQVGDSAWFDIDTMADLATAEASLRSERAGAVRHGA